MGLGGKKHAVVIQIDDMNDIPSDKISETRAAQADAVSSVVRFCFWKALKLN